MKRKQVLTAVVTSLFITTACTLEKEIQEEINAPVALQLSSRIKASMRSNTQSTSITEGQTVYAWADKTTGDPHIKAWTLRAKGDNTFTGSARYFPQSGEALNIYALHGHFGTDMREDITDFPASGLIHTVSADQTTTVEYAKSDLLYAAEKSVARTGASGGTKRLVLNFYHLLSKVEIALKAGTGLTRNDLNGATVTLMNTKLKADFRPEQDNEISDGTTRAAMVRPAATENTPEPILIPAKVIPGDDFSGADYAEAVIVPQTIGDAGEIPFIKVNLASGRELYYKINNKTFESGKKYIFNITVNLPGLEVTSGIEDWADGGTTSGDAEADENEIVVREDGTWRIVLDSEREKTYNIVFLGDGFIEEDNVVGGAFDKEVEKSLDFIFSKQPLKTYKDYFKVYQVYAHSNERGADKNARENIIDTKFDATFGWNGINRLLVIRDEWTAITYANKALPNYHMIFVLVNDPMHGGSGGNIITASVNDWSHLTALHEMGHRFGLGDEYEDRLVAIGKDRKEAALYSNLDITGDPTKVKWKHFIGRPGYSSENVYEGGYYFSDGVWRPSRYSIMNILDTDQGFNAISREAIVRHVFQWIGETFDMDEFYRRDDPAETHPTPAAISNNPIPMPPPLELYYESLYKKPFRPHDANPI